MSEDRLTEVEATAYKLQKTAQDLTVLAADLLALARHLQAEVIDETNRPDSPF